MAKGLQVVNPFIRNSVIAAVLIAALGCANLGHKNDAPLNQSEQYYDFIQSTFSEYLDTTETWLRINRT